MQEPGIVRVGQTIKNRTTPEYLNFTPIWVTTRNKQRGKDDFSDLSPYYLKNDYGQIMENIWQFSKIYETVPAVKEKLHYYSNTIIWQWQEEKHIIDNVITDKYQIWRSAGMNNKYPVRYPAGYRGRSSCVGALWYNETMPNGSKYLDYITSRKKIYVPVYTNLVKQHPRFQDLKLRHLQGENLLIIDVDGPAQELAAHYAELGVTVEKSTVVVNVANMQALLNDPVRPFGHGYCLAMALLDINIC